MSMCLYIFFCMLTLVFSVPPKIVSSSPTSFHQPLGSMVKIFCKAEGSPKPNVTWTKDGRSIFTSQRITYQSEGSEIIINNLQDDDGGIFKCTYRNTVGLITQTIHLIVEGSDCVVMCLVCNSRIDHCLRAFRRYFCLLFCKLK